jgi:hypothetical protein
MPEAIRNLASSTAATRHAHSQSIMATARRPSYGNLTLMVKWVSRLLEFGGTPDKPYLLRVRGDSASLLHASEALESVALSRREHTHTHMHARTHTHTHAQAHAHAHAPPHMDDKRC